MWGYVITDISYRSLHACITNDQSDKAKPGMAACCKLSDVRSVFLTQNFLAAEKSVVKQQLVHPQLYSETGIIIIIIIITRCTCKYLAQCVDVTAVSTRHFDIIRSVKIIYGNHIC